MATTTKSFTQWLKMVKEAATAGKIENAAGYPVAEAARKLDLHRSRVHQLIEEGVLDAIQIKTWKGTVAMTLVTEASMERYLADRVPDRGRQGYFAFPTS